MFVAGKPTAVVLAKRRMDEVAADLLDFQRGKYVDWTDPNRTFGGEVWERTRVMGKYEKFGRAIDRCQSPIERAFLVELLLVGQYGFDATGDETSVARIFF